MISSITVYRKSALWLQLITGEGVMAHDVASPDLQSIMEAEEPAGPAEINEYEVRRQLNIERNQQKLASL